MMIDTSLASSPTGLSWQETFLAGSAGAEDELVRRFAREINDLQDSMACRGDGVARRGFHAKGIAGIGNATFEASGSVPETLRVGLFQPGRTCRAAVRFSNSVSDIQPDPAKQGRGIGVRLFAPAGFHDLLLSNSPTSHARDAIQFMALASALRHRWKLLVLFGLIRRVACARRSECCSRCGRPPAPSAAWRRQRTGAAPPTPSGHARFGWCSGRRRRRPRHPPPPRARITCGRSWPNGSKPAPSGSSCMPSCLPMNPARRSRTVPRNGGKRTAHLCRLAPCSCPPRTWTRRSAVLPPTRSRGWSSTPGTSKGDPAAGQPQQGPPRRLPGQRGAAPTIDRGCHPPPGFA